MTHIHIDVFISYQDVLSVLVKLNLLYIGIIIKTKFLYNYKLFNILLFVYTCNNRYNEEEWLMTLKVTVKILGVIFMASLISQKFAYSNPVITTGQLIEEIVDIDKLTKFPEIDYKLVQFSSYDRRSVQRLHRDWFSNNDGFGGEPIPNVLAVLKEEKNGEDGEYLLAEIKGPGAIVRTETAGIIGNLRVYLDNETTPFYEGPAESFLKYPYDLYMSGTKITRDLLEGALYQKSTVYCPIPFAKYCKIIWIGKIKDIHFYMISIRCYEEGTAIKTFSQDDIKVYEEQIIRVCNILKNPDKLIEGRERIQKTVESKLPYRKEVVVWEDNSGPGAVVKMKLRIKDKLPHHTLREVILRIYADGIQEPLVDSPLIDFFASAPGINPYQSIMMEVTPDGWLISRFIMPYQQEMEITLRNVTNEILTVEGEVVSQKYEWDFERSMYFCARWKGNDGIWLNNNRQYDIPFLYATGKGCVVGAVSHIFNTSNAPTSDGNWWGEGDEKIYINGETFPSIFGIGTEDFYNYSWSLPDIFCHPNCGQPRNDGPGNRGFVSNFRWMLVDRIPFQKSISFSLELILPDEVEDVYDMGYARIAYYYARPETSDDHSPIPDRVYNPLSARQDWTWYPSKVRASKNGLFFQAEDCVVNTESIETIQSYMWAGKGLCLWKPQSKGDTLSFNVNILQEGEYDIWLILALSPQSGNIQVLWDNKVLTEKPISLYDEYHTLSREFRISREKISAGTHTLTLKPTDSESKTFGVDFIWIQPVKK